LKCAASQGGRRPGDAARVPVNSVPQVTCFVR
jgi:hypothetical protein